MIYLKSINWTNDAIIDKRALRKRLFPLDIEFKESVTVIVGSNGTGKTRLLKNIEKKAKILDEMRGCNPNGKHMHYLTTLDSEIEITLTVDSNMPYTRIVNYDSDSLYSSDFNGDMLQIARHWMSNGETKDIIVERIKNCANSLRKDNLYGVMLLDELDNSLDYKKQRKFARVLKQSSDVMQFIVATHNVPFMSQFKEVFDIETKQYINTNDYLKKILKIK